MRWNLFKATAWLVFLSGTVSPEALATAQELPLVLVVSGNTASPYQKTQVAFERKVRASRQVQVVNLSSDSSTGSYSGPPPSLVFALGRDGIEKSRELDMGSPVLATMILSSSALGQLPHATAVLLRSSAATQLQWHKRLLPDARRVGVLYDPNQSQGWIDEAKKAAVGLDLEIVAIKVSNPKELPGALKAISRRADTLLGIPDKTVYSGSTAKAVLLFSFRQRIPFIGMSGAWVKAGALYGVDWDYADLGSQCADVALSILDGTDPAMITAQTPDSFHYQINLKTAKKLNVRFSEDLIGGASLVYK